MGDPMELRLQDVLVTPIAVLISPLDRCNHQVGVDPLDDACIDISHL